MIERPQTKEEWGTPASVADQLRERGVTARMIYDWKRDGLLSTDGPEADVRADERGRLLVRFDAAAAVERATREKGRPRAARVSLTTLPHVSDDERR